jgi:predicted metal-binding membrane protein
VTLARLALFAVLAGLSLGGWGLSMSMAHAHGSLLPLFGMWAAMTIAMMIPIEGPSIVRLATRDAPAYLAGYFVPWITFSFAAAGLQTQLHHTSAGLGAALLIAAGAAQISPWKRACLERCRVAPVGGLPAGLRAGAFSVLSCGLLMLIPLVTGMHPLAMVLLTLFCALERAVPRMSSIAGVGLAGWGLLLP